MEDNGTVHNTLPDEVMPDINMLHVVVINRIPGKELGTAVVDEESSQLSDVLLKVVHKPLKPHIWLQWRIERHLTGVMTSMKLVPQQARKWLQTWSVRCQDPWHSLSW